MNKHGSACDINQDSPLRFRLLRLVLTSQVGLHLMRLAQRSKLDEEFAVPERPLNLGQTGSEEYRYSGNAGDVSACFLTL